MAIKFKALDDATVAVAAAYGDFLYETAPTIAVGRHAVDTVTAKDVADNFVSRQTYAFLHTRYMLALDEVKGLRAQVAATAPNSAKLADEIMSRIERDRDYHGAAISRDALIDVAVMCGCKKD